MWNLPTVLIGLLVGLLLMLAIWYLVRPGGSGSCGECRGCGKGCAGCSASGGCPNRGSVK